MIETVIRGIEELLKANLSDTFFRSRKYKVQDRSFLDLHVHLRVPGNEEEAKRFLDMLTKRVDGIALSYFGRKESGIASYDDFIDALRKFLPRNYFIFDRGLGALVRNENTEQETVIFKAQEFDRTKQGLDVMGVGVREYIPNPNVMRPDSFDACEIADKFRRQGAFTYIEHFCADEITTIPEEKRKSWHKGLSRLGWCWRTYNKKGDRKELIRVFDSVDAVEIFNGFTMLWMAVQNAISYGVIEEYLKRGNKAVIAGSDTHLDIDAVGCAGIYFPTLDLSLDGVQILEQVKDYISKKRIELKTGYCGLGSFLRSLKLLEEEREKSN